MIVKKALLAAFTFTAFAASVFARGGWEILEPGTGGVQHIEVTGIIRALGSARESSPALILDEESIAVLDDAYRVLGLIGPGADQLFRLHQGEQIPVIGKIIAPEEYQREYRERYPLAYLMFDGYLFVENP
jgi:hypothetical protein